MNFKSRFLSLLSLLLAGSMVFVACSSDDGGTGPSDTGPAIQTKISPGDYFDYNRWALDKDNNKDGASWKYRVTYLDNNDVFIGAYKDFVYLKEENRDTNTKLSDKTALRNDPQGNLYIYNFQHDLYSAFFDLIRQFDPTVNVNVPYQQWDSVAYFNDASGKAHAKGFQWTITATNMQDFHFNVNAGIAGTIEFTLRPEIVGIYDGVVDPITVNGKKIECWQIRRITTMKIRSSLLNQDIPITETILYSDDPNGIIFYKRESANLEVPLIGTYTLPGDQQELYFFVKF